MNRKLINELQASYRQAERDGMVKVAIPGGPLVEFCWAKRLSNHFARLANCCVCGGDVNHGDVVEFREQAEPHPIHKEFVRVVSRGSRQWAVVYATPSEAASSSARVHQRLKKRRGDVSQFLKKARSDGAVLAWEGVELGVLCVALPVSTSDEDAERLLHACPHLIEADES
jgi:hypothetical protein